jgi:hypothetical protein
MRRVLFLLLLAGCAAPDFVITHAPQDAAAAREVEACLAAARPRIERALGMPLRVPVAVTVAPSRAAFDATIPPEWGIQETQCWMVAWGVADRLAVLSPRAWAAEACEHDAADASHVSRLLAHELVHVLHGQNNSHPDFTGLDAIGWFAEGLAVLGSGQLEQEHAGRAREALDAGRGPRDLAHAWSGPWKYGVCGALVAFWRGRAGEGALARALGATSNVELLGAVGMEEGEFLEAWGEWVLGGRRESSTE